MIFTVLGGTAALTFCFFLSQSKKNYELRCKEADEAEQGAEKATIASKNSDKVQERNNFTIRLKSNQSVKELLP